jgi:hypothetical protein
MCHASLPLNQDELTASALSSGNASSHHLLSRAETEPLNLHHHSRSPSQDRLTPTLHYYKKIISTVVTLPTTQSHLHFASSLARASHHQNSTQHRLSLSPLSHTHHPSTQLIPHWWTSRPSFASQTTYRHVNSYDIHLKLCFHYCVLRDEINKTRSQLHMFSIKIKLRHHCFKYSPLIWSG